MKTNLEKLKTLCDVVNKRYAKGLNDDDEVKKMFDFENLHEDVKIVIGSDDYQAITKDDFEKEFENSNDVKSTDVYTSFKFFIGNKYYTGII